MPENRSGETGFWGAMESRPWDELIAEEWGGYQPPLTTHLPIHPVQSPDFLHVGPAFQVTRQRIVPGLSANDMEALVRVGHDETLVVQFAFGEAPALPDFRRTCLTLEDGLWPIAHAEVYAHEGLLYRFEYFSRALPEDPRQTILWIQGTVSNDKGRLLQGHVRAKVNFPHEDELLDYHYQPFYWDSHKLLPSTEVVLEGDEIRRGGKCIGVVHAQDFHCEWEAAMDFEDSAYGRPAVEFSPPHPSLRYHHVRDAIHLHATLPPGARATFELAFLVNYEDATESHRAALHAARRDVDRDAALQHFASAVNPEGVAARLDCVAGNWGNVLAHLPLGIFQLMANLPGVNGWMPTPGGSSERHFIWVGEALHMLVPLLKLGHFGPVRQALEFIFSLQDSGFKPEGRLSSTEGAIGTSGPKWLNSTGAALTIGAEYYLYSRDAAFLREYLPRMLRAADWIIAELQATRRLNPDDSRPPWYGLMPFGCGNDGDFGYMVTFTDAYTFAGLEKVAFLLEETGHERARELRREVEQYRADIAHTVAGLARPDGFIDRAVVTGDPEEEIYAPFDLLCGASHLAGCRILAANEMPMDAYTRWMERHVGDDFFFGRMDRDTAYMGWPEWTWQEIYLQNGEWKKAFALTQINLKYAKTRETHQTQERFRPSDPTFCPWQPNGSGNGRIIDMIFKAIFVEHQEVATLFGAVPFAWLRQNGTTALTNFRTPRGVLSIEADMVDSAHCSVRLTAANEGAMPRHIRFPDHFTVTAAGDFARPSARDFVLPAAATRFECVLSQSPPASVT